MTDYTDEEAVAITGAVGRYLGHNKFKILNIKKVSENVDVKNNEGQKATNNGLLSFFGFLKPKN